MAAETKIEDLKRQYVRQAGDTFDRLLRDYVDSPIERIFLGEMLVGGWSHPDQSEWTETLRKCQAAGAISKRTILLHDGCMSAATQLVIRASGQDYRVDFAFFCSTSRMVVELDGHDFHERTKEQARKDKARDRALTENGWLVMRFTGSEVYSDSDACLQQVIAALFANEERLTTMTSKGGAHA